MTTAQVLSADAFAGGADEKSIMPREAAQYIHHLQHAFRASASHRADAETWRELENTIAAELDRRRSEARFEPSADVVQRFDQADERLYNAAGKLLAILAPTSGRARRYKGAVDDVRGGAAPWGRFLDDPLMAYCRHAALVWITLWHVSDTPAATSEEIGRVLRQSWLPEQGIPDCGNSLEAPPQLLARTLRAVAAALRRGDEAR